AFLENRYVMDHVAGGQVCERTDGKRIPARYAASTPRFVGKTAKERDRRRSNRQEFVEMAAPCPYVRTGERHSHVLIEAGQRRVEAARKPERSRDKKTLSIVDMADNFTDAPFVGCVPTERLLVGDDLQECKRFRRLTV